MKRLLIFSLLGSYLICLRNIMLGYLIVFGGIMDNYSYAMMQYFREVSFALVIFYFIQKSWKLKNSSTIKKKFDLFLLFRTIILGVMCLVYYSATLLYMLYSAKIKKDIVSFKIGLDIL